MSPAWWHEVRQLRQKNGLPLWSFMDGHWDVIQVKQTLLGYPVRVSANAGVPTLAAFPQFTPGVILGNHPTDYIIDEVHVWVNRD